MTNNLLKLAEKFEKKYQRVNQNPDTLNPTDTGFDPEGIMYPHYDETIEESEGNPRISHDAAEYLFGKVWPHFITLNKGEQTKFLSQLANKMSKV